MGTQRNEVEVQHRADFSLARDGEPGGAKRHEVRVVSVQRLRAVQGRARGLADALQPGAEDRTAGQDGAPSSHLPGGNQGAPGPARARLDPGTPRGGREAVQGRHAALRHGGHHLRGTARRDDQRGREAPVLHPRRAAAPGPMAEHGEGAARLRPADEAVPEVEDICSRVRTLPQIRLADGP